jgi:hypothetical protein
VGKEIPSLSTPDREVRAEKGRDHAGVRLHRCWLALRFISVQDGKGGLRDVRSGRGLEVAFDMEMALGFRRDG